LFSLIKSIGILIDLLITIGCFPETNPLVTMSQVVCSTLPSGPGQFCNAAVLVVSSIWDSQNTKKHQKTPQNIKKHQNTPKNTKKNQTNREIVEGIPWD